MRFGGTFLTVYSLAAEDFAVRRVTDLVNSNFGSRGTPLAVLNDALLFLAIENSRMGLYRTDGTNVELIDNSVAIATSSNALTSVEAASWATSCSSPQRAPTAASCMQQTANRYARWRTLHRERSARSRANSRF